MLEIMATERWHAAFPGGHVGILLVGNVDNTPRATALDERKRAIEASLRDRYAGYSRTQLQEIDILRAYRTYYKKFGKTYHVQLQLESVVNHGKSLPHVSPLVDANFAAELDTLILTAGHDADKLEAPITIDATQGDESFTSLGGAVRTLKPNDMMMTDAKGVVCTIIYGQDARTPIVPTTRRALYVAYAPAGIPAAAVQRQLDSIRDHVLLVAPEAVVEQTAIFGAD